MALQHPKITVAWAVASLERALADLGDSPAEERTRRQFHQLLLALEHDGYVFLDPRLFPGPKAQAPVSSPGRVLPMPPRPPLAG